MHKNYDILRNFHDITQSRNEKMQNFCMIIRQSHFAKTQDIL